MFQHNALAVVVTMLVCGCGPGGDVVKSHSAAPVCGNGQVELAEACDSGDRNSNIWAAERHCNADCTGWGSHCGDGFRNAEERCDQGALNSDVSTTVRHCNANCRRWVGVCGDGIVDRPLEQCDDGEANSDLSSTVRHCNARCTAIVPVCGDRVIDRPAEQCDEGDWYNADWSPAQHCNATCSGPGHYCGDGVVDSPHEGCDDGDRNSDEWGPARHCNAACSRILSVCGDGIIDADEQCEGDNLQAATCETYAHLHGALGCTGVCLYDLTSCQNYCGNDRCDFDEDRTSCAADCDQCGNGVCDLGESSSICPADCAVCGDGVCADTEDQNGCPADCGAIQLSGPCVLLADRTVRCWGGMFGTRPIHVPGLDGALSIAASRTSLWDNMKLCALRPDRTVVCLDRDAQPIAVAGLTDVAQVATDDVHACAVLLDGTVWCWGDNAAGQLGDGSYVASATPVRVVGIDSATGVAVQSAEEYGWGGIALFGRKANSCALLADGTARCWGDNSTGQLGGPEVGADSNVPVAVSGLTGAVELSLFADIGCALLQDRSVSCWGDWYLPARVIGLSGIVAIGEGCAVATDGRARCWKDAGRGVAWPDEVPRTIDQVTEVRSIAQFRIAIDMQNDRYVDVFQGWTRCILNRSGLVYCQGDNRFGELGQGSYPYSAVSQPVGSLAGIQAVTAESGSIGGNTCGSYPCRDTSYGFSCALSEPGEMWCWGGYSVGAVNPAAVPMQVGPNDLVAIDQRQTLLWVVRSDGTVWKSDLGFREVPVFVEIPGIQSALTVSQGCALIADGTVTCWDNNDLGATTPSTVSGVTDAVEVAASDDGYQVIHACARIADGRVVCWGSNADGQLGDGTTTDRAAPAEVTGLTGATSLALKTRTSCAIDSQHRMWCWGAGYGPQPLLIIDSGVTSVALARSHACAVMDDGTVQCWGSRHYGCLGDGMPSADSSVDVASRIEVIGLSDAIAVALGDEHACALLSDRTLRCWGRNNYGQLGVEPIASSDVPLPVAPW